MSLLEELIIHREAHLYPLLATTNLSPNQFRNLFGNRVFDRLKGEWGVWINVDRPSFRTTNTSSGTPSSRATWNPTGTPPRGSASTTTS